MQAPDHELVLQHSAKSLTWVLTLKKGYFCWHMLCLKAKVVRSVFDKLRIGQILYAESYGAIQFAK